jgi:hypothetical protein
MSEQEQRMLSQAAKAVGLLAFGLSFAALFWIIASVFHALTGEGESIWHYIADLLSGRLTLQAFAQRFWLLLQSAGYSGQIMFASLGFAFGVYIAGLRQQVPRAEAAQQGSAREKTFAPIQRAFPTIHIAPVERAAICRFLDVLTLGICDFFVVPQGFILLVMAFGRYRSYRNPGLQQILSFWGTYQRPWMHLVPTLEQKEEFTVSGVTTSDGIHCDVDALFSFRIVDPGKVIFEVAEFDLTIKLVAVAFLRDECGKMKLQDLLASRSQMAEAAKASLTAHAERWGLYIPLFDVLEITVLGAQKVG